MDSLYVQDIEIWTHIGVPETERATEQRILVSVELFTELKNVAKNDELGRGIDYQQVTDGIRALAATPRKTLERLVEDVAEHILATYSPVGGVKVSAQKFVLPGVRAVHATIFRKP
jgi:dihydroneopterin aldolase